MGGGGGGGEGETPAEEKELQKFIFKKMMAANRSKG